MGSFSEAVLSFNFSKETPPEVLAAFARLAVPGLPAEAPALPEPVVEPWDRFEPDWRDAGYGPGEGDPHELEPWRHDWASWVSIAMGVQTTPHGRLAWSDLGLWNLDCRFSWKTGPDTVSEALAWLAPFADTTYFEEPILVGHVHFEYAPRPHLFWVEDGRWKLEDLNPNDDWQW